VPIYEYRCTSCGETVEAIQKFSDAPLRKCARCSGTLEKLVSRAAFQLKGGGWFANDYGVGKSSSPGKGGGKEGATADAKPSDAPSKPAGGGCGSGSCGCAH
jgi:putative FmdB family regulatory protein